jgi:hypothetical protein
VSTKVPTRPLSLAVVLLGLSMPAAAAPDFAAVDKLFRGQVKGGKYEDRLRSFDLWAKSSDPRAVETLIWAAELVTTEQDAVRRGQEEAEGVLEATLDDIEELNRQMAASQTVSDKQVTAFNRRVQKLESQRDASYTKLRDLATQAGRLHALADAAISALGAVGTNLDASAATAALDRIEAAWTGPKSTGTERRRTVDVLGRIRQPDAATRLRAFALRDTEEGPTRAAALAARVARRDDGALEDVVALLGASEDLPWEVRAEAIASLEALRRKEGIEPLIVFLGRDGTGRLREDATRALRALTGQAHGPYAQPWQDWWETAKSTFTIPDTVTPPPAPPRGEGVTFYGITTFSERILFVLDVSGSMLSPADPTGVKEEPRKIDLARRELNGALDMLDEPTRFNLLFFGHSVVRYRPGMIPANALSRGQAKRFAADWKPAGGTNIHDALEQAFRIAGTAADGKVYAALVDTVFFLTDGTPTAGKLQDPKLILEAVRDWNRHAHLTIHCVCLGDGDEAFLQSLAAQNGGQFVKR